MRSGLGILISFLALTSAGPAFGQQASGGKDKPLFERPEYNGGKSGAQINAWRFREDWLERQVFANSYEAALQFATCFSRYDKDADKLLSLAIGTAGDREALVRAARRHRACVVEHAQVAPVLLRVAIAETLIKRKQPLTTIAAKLHSPGVPAVVDGYPVEAITRCQTQAAPVLASQVLRTRPGSREEVRAVHELSRYTAHCGSSISGSLSPTAARLALVDALFHRASLGL